MDESLELARIAVADGIRQAIVTPHIHPGRWDNAAASIAQRCEEFRQALQQASVPLELGYAAEVRLGEHILSAIANEDIPFYGKLGQERVMLLEFPHGHVLPGTEQLISWLIRRGVRPLIAHPERNREIMGNIDRLLPFLQQGCLLQLTGGSLLGQFGDRAHDVAVQLMEQDMVYVIASDGHNIKARPPVLSAAMQWVSSRYGEERAERLFRDNPALLVSAQFAGTMAD